MYHHHTGYPGAILNQFQFEKLIDKAPERAYTNSGERHVAKEPIWVVQCFQKVESVCG